MQKIGGEWFTVATPKGSSWESNEKKYLKYLKLTQVFLRLCQHFYYWQYWNWQRNCFNLFIFSEWSTLHLAENTTDDFNVTDSNNLLTATTKPGKCPRIDQIIKKLWNLIFILTFSRSSDILPRRKLWVLERFWCRTCYRGSCKNANR